MEKNHPKKPTKKTKRNVLRKRDKLESLKTIDTTAGNRKDMLKNITKMLNRLINDFGFIS